MSDSAPTQQSGEPMEHSSINVRVAKEAPYKEGEVIETAFEIKEDSAPIEGTVHWQLCAAMMSWVGCLLTDYVLSVTWKLREWE